MFVFFFFLSRVIVLVLFFLSKIIYRFLESMLTIPLYVSEKFNIPQNCLPSYKKYLKNFKSLLSE